MLANPLQKQEKESGDISCNLNPDKELSTKCKFHLVFGDLSRIAFALLHLHIKRKSIHKPYSHKVSLVCHVELI